ncbi:MAG: hypothetical protein H9Q65_06280 [Spiroplasma ixodetis]|nr:hypothetical protein [Spiroplasma ixodetis]MBP1528829.1 hypothetical protein [Spiroplasma ixodetis]
MLLIIILVKYFPYSPFANVQSAGIKEGILLLSNSFVIDNQLNWLSSSLNNSFWLISLLDGLHFIGH